MWKACFVTIVLLCCSVCALSVGAVENEADTVAENPGTETSAEDRDSGMASDKEDHDEERLTTAEEPDDTPAAEPEEEPHGFRSTAYGLPH